MEHGVQFIIHLEIHVYHSYSHVLPLQIIAPMIVPLQGIWECSPCQRLNFVSTVLSKLLRSNFETKKLGIVMLNMVLSTRLQPLLAHNLKVCQRFRPLDCDLQLRAIFDNAQREIPQTYTKVKNHGHSDHLGRCARVYLVLHVRTTDETMQLRILNLTCTVHCISSGQKTGEDRYCPNRGTPRPL